MTRIVVNVTEARENLAELLGRVKCGEDMVTVEKKGQPYAVILSPQEYARYREIAKKALQHTMEAIQAQNPAVTEEEVMKDVTKTVAAVRQDR
jgi:prevent-host-death family protein